METSNNRKKEKECIDCKRVVKIYAKGLCWNCYQKQYKKNNREKFKTYQKFYQKQYRDSCKKEEIVENGSK